jgi:hypothetical protein
MKMGIEVPQTTAEVPKVGGVVQRCMAQALPLHGETVVVQAATWC